MPSTANAGTTEVMGSDKKPDTSKVEGKPEPKAETKVASADVKSNAKPDDKPAHTDDKHASEPKDDYDKPRSKTEAVEPTKDLPPIEPPEPGAEPWPDATPQPMKPVAAPAKRQHTETVGMPTGAQFGRPPEMPKTTAPPPLALGTVENPTYMPAPKDVPSGNADDPAPAPGIVPSGDSRSMRRGDEFALIYRVGTYVITRFGTVGKRGQWRVVEYPTSASASHSYAKECSRFASEGFSDYRE